MKLSKEARASMEAIAFQSGGILFKELTTIFENFIDGRKFTTEEFAKTGIREIVLKRTGILIKPIIRFSMAPNAGVLPPDLNKNNPIATLFDRAYMESKDGFRSIREAKAAIQGTVDLNAGTVDGIFSKIECKLAVYTGLLTSGLSASEIAAICLHEIGHIFSYYEFITDTVTTNQALASISKAVISEPSHDKRVIIIAQTEKELNVALSDRNKLADARDAQTIHTVLISAKVEKIRSALGTGVYDNVSWEYLSDQFAARHGAGRDLAVAIHKLNAFSGDPAYVSTTAHVMQQIAGLLFMAGAVVAVPLLGSILSIMVFGVSSIKLEDEYDNLDVRLKRIRAQVVEAIKAKDLDKYEREALLDDIKVIDTIVADMKTRRGIFEVFWDVVRPYRRKVRKEYVMQQQLEQLASNSLFVHSADLKNISESA